MKKVQALKKRNWVITCNEDRNVIVDINTPTTVDFFLNLESGNFCFGYLARLFLLVPVGSAHALGNGLKDIISQLQTVSNGACGQNNAIKFGMIICL